MNLFRAALSCCAAAIMSPAVADVCLWANDNVGNTPASAYAWSDPLNWKNSLVPGGSASDAVAFTNCALGARFVKMPDATLVKEVYFADSGFTCLIGEEIRAGKLRAVTANAPVASRIYADLRPATGGDRADLNFGTVEICGDIAEGDQKITLVNAVGTTGFRFDLYANSADPHRVDPCSTYLHNIGWGTFRFMAPRGSDVSVASSWTTVEGSRHAVLADGADALSLPVGCMVTTPGDVLGEGTFLRRIYDGKTIELSSAARSSGTYELVFAPFSPVVEQSVYQLLSQTATLQHLDLSKYREKDVFRYTAQTLRWQNHDDDPDGEKYERLSLVSSTGIPGTLVILDGTGFCTSLILESAHVEFGKSGNAVAGLPNAKTVRMAKASDRARLTVPEGVAAVVNGFSGICGLVRKDGAGQLTVRMKPSRDANGSLLNSGTVAIDEGTMKFVAMQGGAVEIAKLQLAAGATIELDGDMTVTESLAAAEGASIGGSGVLTVPFGTVLPQGLAVSASVVVAKRLPDSAGRPVYDYPQVKVVGEPAFWVSADRSLVFATGDGETPGSTVKRWNDCRGSDGKYMFATNVAAVYPVLQTNTFGRSLVQIQNVSGIKASQIDQSAALVWDRPLSGIRHVFMVQEVFNNADSSGGMILGSSPRISSCDFYRANSDSQTAYSRIVSSSCAPAVKSAIVRFNGVKSGKSPVETQYPYVSYVNKTYGNTSKPHLLELEIEEGAEADAFGFCNREDGNNGRGRIYECIVYTNGLTAAERLKVAEYLMVKHMRSHVDYRRFDPVGEAIDELSVSAVRGVGVPAGDTAVVKSLAGSGEFVKTGDGELYVDDLVSEGLALKIREGVFSLRSVKVSADDLPVEPVVHLDASDVATTDFAANDSQGVSRIADRRGQGYPVAVCRNPGTLMLVAPDAVGGRTMIDFGEYVDSNNPGQAMKFQLDGSDIRILDLRSTIAVIGTAKGGGFLAGDLARNRNYNQMGGIWRDASNYANGMVSSSVGNPILLRSTSKSAARWRLNGEDVADPTSRGFSGGYDLVSMAIAENFGMNGLNACNYGTRSGGQELGEQLFFDETLSSEQVLAIEAYLKSKWFGADTEGYRGASVGSLEVGAGAVLRVYGNSPLKVASLAGTGQIAGKVSIAGGGAFTVKIAGGNSIVPLAVGEIGLAGEVALHVEGDVDSLAPGLYPVVVSSGISAGDSCGWTVATSSLRRNLELVAVDGALALRVSRKGLSVIVR